LLLVTCYLYPENMFSVETV